LPGRDQGLLPFCPRVSCSDDAWFEPAPRLKPPCLVTSTASAGLRGARSAAAHHTCCDSRSRGRPCSHCRDTVGLWPRRYADRRLQARHPITRADSGGKHSQLGSTHGAGYPVSNRNNCQADGDLARADSNTHPPSYEHADTHSYGQASFSRLRGAGCPASDRRCDDAPRVGPI
jgi:hypothetical protein